MKADIGSESRFLPTLPAFDAPVREGLPECCHAVWYGKTRMASLPDGKRLEDIFIRFDRMFERDGHTHRVRERSRL